MTTFSFVENFIKHLGFCQENNAFYFFIAYLMLFAVELNSTELQSVVCTNPLVWVTSILNKESTTGCVLKSAASMQKCPELNSMQARHWFPKQMFDLVATFSTLETVKIFDTNFLKIKPSFVVEANEIMIHYCFHLWGWAVQSISMEQKQEQLLVILRDSICFYICHL